jgi:hypothetical protein
VSDIVLTERRSFPAVVEYFELSKNSRSIGRTNNFIQTLVVLFFYILTLREVQRSHPPPPLPLPRLSSHIIITAHPACAPFQCSPTTSISSLHLYLYLYLFLLKARSGVRSTYPHWAHSWYVHAFSVQFVRLTNLEMPRQLRMSSVVVDFSPLSFLSVAYYVPHQYPILSCLLHPSFALTPHSDTSHLLFLAYSGGEATSKIHFPRVECVLYPSQVRPSPTAQYSV